MKKRDLVVMLAHLGDEDEVLIAGVPDVCGWLNDVVPALGVTSGGEFVLGACEGAFHDVEVGVVWPVRPI